MEFNSLDDLLAKLPPEQRRRIEQNARKNIRRQITCNMPAVRDLLTQEQMKSPMSGYYHDQPGNDIALAWYFWAVREDHALFDAECRTTPPHQLVHVLFLLRKILRHPEWKLALQYRPSDDHFARRREHLEAELGWRQGLMPARQSYIADLQRNARRYAGLEA